MPFRRLSFVASLSITALGCGDGPAATTGTDDSGATESTAATGHGDGDGSTSATETDSTTPSTEGTTTSATVETGATDTGRTSGATTDTDDSGTSGATESGRTQGDPSDGGSTDGGSSDGGANEGCGDGVWQPGEGCDDGNVAGGDGCEADCTPSVMVATGSFHNCARSAAGKLRCWGHGFDGELGYAVVADIGDDETVESFGDVQTGGVVRKVVAGSDHTCVLLDGGTVRCWGSNKWGQLGIEDASWIGDDETPASVAPIDVGGEVIDLAAGDAHTCAVLAGGGLRCWGWADYGQLGLGNTTEIGDDEDPSAAVLVDVGGGVSKVWGGGFHTCALLESGAVRCWGLNDDGQLGIGNVNTIGDNELPASAGPVVVGGVVVSLALGHYHTCALLHDGGVRCWGWGGLGQLGYGNTQNIGDSETPASAGDVPIDGTAVAIGAGPTHTCVVLDTGAIRCFGGGYQNKLGYSSTANIGDDETPASVRFVNVGGDAWAVGLGSSHTCAVLQNGAIRCWGGAEFGQLGHGNENTIGDDETPARAGDVPVW